MKVARLVAALACTLSLCCGLAACSSASTSSAGVGPIATGSGGSGGSGSGGGAFASGGSGTGGGGGGGAMGAPGDANGRTIQEADIYKLVGNTLYILNATKHDLEIVNVTDLTSPKLLATVPTDQSPRQIYVDGKTAYVLTSNVQDVDCGGYQGTCGWSAPGGAVTQVNVINVSNPASPKVVSTQKLPGDLQDSRIVGHILYVTGIDATGASTLVASYDVSNPESFTKEAEVDFPFGDWDIGVFLNVTATRIVVAQTGDTCDLVHDQGSCTDEPVTQFVPIDITDPSGKLTQGTPFLGNGVLWDRWAMDFNPTTGIFRAVMSSDWNGNSGGGELAVWSAPTTTSAPTKLGTLTFTAGDHVTSTAFAGSRVYVSSNTSGTGCPDPVVVLDTTNPEKPVKLGSVRIPGVNDLLYPHGNQLISLGHAEPGDTNACGQGQGYVSFQGSGQLAVSLFDVSDPSKPTLLSQVTFGATNSTIAANRNDLRKAFLVVDSMGLIIVPFQNVNPTATQDQSDVQLVDLGASQLTLRGMAPHQGLVKRAFPVQDDLVAFSDQTLQVLDISDRDKPATAAQLTW